MTATTASPTIDRAVGLLATLLLAFAASFAIETVSGPSSGAPFGMIVPVAAISLLFHAQWGAMAVGVVALWSAVHEIPMRRPIALFALGIAASLAVQAAGNSAYHSYKNLVPSERSGATQQPNR